MPPKSSPDGLHPDFFRSGRQRRSALWLGFSIVLAISAIVALFFAGEYVQRFVRYGKERQPSVYTTTPFPYEALRHIILHTVYELPMPSRAKNLLSSGLPVYDLRIGRNNLKSLQQTAEMVLARGLATDVPREFFRAEFRMGDEWVPVQVKPRGLTAYHYLKKRPSLRVRFPRDRYFGGIREINLLEPYDKGLTADLTTNWELQRYGILTWKSRFVVLRINGDLIGLFQEIEQFGESIPARNRRSEGYIFSGAGQLFGSEGTDFEKASRASDLVRRCAADNLGQIGSHCADWSFARDYFDLDRWAWAAAMSALLNSRHAWAPDNLRMFWDPARGKFEPIPWDYLYYPIDATTQQEGEADHSGYLSASLLAMPEFRKMRDRRLWVLLTERLEPMIEYADELFSELTPALRNDVRHLRFGADVGKQAEYTNTLKKNAEILSGLFHRQDLRLRYRRGEGDELLTVEIENWGKSFVVAESLELERDGARFQKPLASRAEVPGLWGGEPGRAAVKVEVVPGARLVGIGGRNGVTGRALVQSEIGFSEADSIPDPGPGLAPAAAPAISAAGVEIEPSRVVFGPGRVVLEETVEIPASHDTVFEAGLDLRVGPGVVIVVRGDLTSVGTATAPIRVSARRSEEPWGGIFVQGTRTEPSRVHIRHTTIEGGAGGHTERTRFSSPFSIHDGNVVIESSEFLRSVAEDGLNLKYVTVDLEDSLLGGSLSDGLDCDFCTGRIVDNRIVDVGGDGLDFSGSTVEVTGNRIRGCADKGLSVGEQTEAAITATSVDSCYTGIAVKDRSVVDAQGIRFENLEVGVSLYVKKQTFGPSVASVMNLDMRGVKSEFLIESSCLLASR